MLNLGNAFFNSSTSEMKGRGEDHPRPAGRIEEQVSASYRPTELSTEEKRDKMRKAVSDYQSAQNGILTEEQKKKLKELRSSSGNAIRLRFAPPEKKEE